MEVVQKLLLAAGELREAPVDIFVELRERPAPVAVGQVNCVNEFVLINFDVLVRIHPFMLRDQTNIFCNGYHEKKNS